MFNSKYFLAIAAFLLSANAAQAIPITDTVEAPQLFFTPTDAEKFRAPYRRSASEDWGWTHGAVAGSITSATLNISAFDVDFSDGERDLIYAYDDGIKTLVGELAGADNAFSFTSLVLGRNFDNDINNGLQVFMDIDSSNDGWLVSLAKSSLSIDGGSLPPANPGPIPAIPEPETYALMLAGLGLMGVIRHRRKNS